MLLAANQCTSLYFAHMLSLILLLACVHSPRSSGIGNLSAHSFCSPPLIAALDSITSPLTGVADHVVKECVLRVLHNLALHDKRRMGS